jgi:hypothetical protein
MAKTIRILVVLLALVTSSASVSAQRRYLSDLPAIKWMQSAEQDRVVQDRVVFCGRLPRARSVRGGVVRPVEVRRGRRPDHRRLAGEPPGRQHEPPAQTLRKICSNRLAVIPTETGGWKISGLTDYSALLKEAGFDAVKAVLTDVANLKGSRVRRAARTEPRTE